MDIARPVILETWEGASIICDCNIKLTSSGLGQVSGDAVLSEEVHVIRVEYSAVDSRSRKRDRLMRELNTSRIHTGLVSSAGGLWEMGMTFGNGPEVLAYECRSDGTMFRRYKG